MPYVNVEALKNTEDAELDEFRLHYSSSSASASAQSMHFVSADSMTASCFVSTVIVPISVPQPPHSRGICLSMVWLLFDVEDLVELHGESELRVLEHHRNRSLDGHLIEVCLEVHW